MVFEGSTSKFPKPFQASGPNLKYKLVGSYHVILNPVELWWALHGPLDSNKGEMHWAVYSGCYNKGSSANEERLLDQANKILWNKGPWGRVRWVVDLFRPVVLCSQSLFSTHKHCKTVNVYWIELLSFFKKCFYFLKKVQNSIKAEKLQVM